MFKFAVLVALVACFAATSAIYHGAGSFIGGLGYGAYGLPLGYAYGVGSYGGRGYHGIGGYRGALPYGGVIPVGLGIYG